MLQTTINAPIQVSSRRARTNLFYEEIREEHARLIAVMRNGVRFYHDDQVRATLSKKFHRSIKTIEDIIFNRV